MIRFTPDFDEDAEKWTVTKRDDTNMPMEQYGLYETKEQAARSAANRNYAAKTRRPVVRREN
jgi:hypothetical protein